mmetsp:Transcript_41971/g.83035  ORF Transcript_41971/g.83035 Transcript_41971/m.83035 type:complete len:135 (+) Transcript_41971:193-597(+)
MTQLSRKKSQITTMVLTDAQSHVEPLVPGHIQCTRNPRRAGMLVHPDSNDGSWNCGTRKKHAVCKFDESSGLGCWRQRGNIPGLLGHQQRQRPQSEIGVPIEWAESRVRACCYLDLGKILHVCLKPLKGGSQHA